MTFYDQLLITVIDKLVIAGILLTAGFYINRTLKTFENQQALRRELEITQNRAALAQLEAQIKELYSPLYGLLRSSQEVYRVALARLPSIKSGSPAPEEGEIWQYFVEEHFLPTNSKIAALITSRIHLVEEDHLPDSWQRFLEHQVQFEVLHRLWKQKNVSSENIIGGGWPSTFNEDVDKSLSRLRREYNEHARRIKQVES